MKAILIIGKVMKFVSRGIDYCIRQYDTTQFKTFGKNSYVSPCCHFSYRTISIGHDTYIGRGCVFQSMHGEIIIGNNVMFGAGVHIHGGDHKINTLGLLMKDVNKEPNCDGVVKICDDVWIGSNAIILKGITINEGAVIGAGAVVTKDVPSYAVAVGNPARIIKYRFSGETLDMHKQMLLNQSK